MSDATKIVIEENEAQFTEDPEETQDTLGNEDELGEDGENEELEDGGEGGEGDESESSGDDDEGEQESWESEEAYLREHGLPGEPKSVDDVIKSYKELLRKTNELQRDKERIDDAPVNPLPQKPAGERFFNENMATNTIETMIKNGQVDESVAQSWKGVAKVMDESFNPFIQQVEGVLNNLAGVNMAMVSELRESSWRRFQHKDLATREELDRILKKSGDFDYNRAFRNMLVSDEGLVSRFANKQQKRGEEKGGKKKTLPRFTSNRRSKSLSQKPGMNIKEYLNPNKTLNERKLNELSTDKRLKVIEQYEKMLAGA